MEKRYSFINNVTGWAVLLFSTIIYVLTIESSASFWDCGEFIASATKLQVGHPPGAPLWSMKARMFAAVAEAFTGNTEYIAYAVNVFSALCSSFTILFLFWSITALAKKITLKSSELTIGHTWGIMFSGIVGALAFTFSDSFWFSAVEAEVYAASSLYTAAVFWLALKWDANAHKPHADRYLILIAYLMGLSIGVHILNLLVIPAIVYIYYFNKNKATLKGFFITGVIGVIILGVVQQVVISYSVEFATKFELFFVNDLGLPFDSGMWIYFLIIAVLLIGGIIYSKKKGFADLQKAVLMVMVILIGYSSFAMIVIRSAANPPMDENNPENILTLLPYLNREQYGDRPLLFGQTFESIQDANEPYVDGTPVYYRNEKAGKYTVADERKGHKPKYNEKTCMYFPRMYSTNGRHVNAYKVWSNYDGTPEKEKRGKRERTIMVKKAVGGGRTEPVPLIVPSQTENFTFFINYQFNFMYWRYFMWNFTGRQNDIQGHGAPQMGDAVTKGNWLSGVPFIDNAHVGDQSNLPASMKDNPGRNEFYFLPLILGIIGLVFQFARHREDAWVVLLLFLMTGVAIIIYLNQTPYQPRERDYAYAGSFYAFAIWIGLGVQALYSYMLGTNKSEEEVTEETGKKGIEAKLMSLGIYEISLTAITFIVVGILATAIFENGGVFGLSCIFIGGAIIAYLLLSLIGSKVLKNNKGRAVFALLITGFIPVIMAAEGWDDHDRSDKYTARDFAKNYLDSCDKNAILFTNGDNDTFPLWYVQEVEGYRTDVRVINLSLLNTDWYIDQAKRKAYDGEAVPFSMEQDQYRQGTRDYLFIQDKWSKNEYHDINKVMDFVKSDSRSTKLPMSSGVMMDYLPTRKFSVPVNKANVLANGTVLPEFADQIPATMNWKLGNGSHLYKAKMMILDLIASNNWERPIYFAITVGSDNYMNLEEYFQLEGLAYKLTPIKHNTQGGTGWVNVEKMYDNLVNQFQWGNMEKEGVYMGEQVKRMSENYRNNFARLARKLIDKGDTARAVKTLDRCMEIMPPSKIPMSYYSVYLAEAYYLAGRPDKGNEISEIILKRYMEETDWYVQQEGAVADVLSKQTSQGKSMIGESINAIKTTEYFLNRSVVKETAKLIPAFDANLTQEAEGLSSLASQVKQIGRDDLARGYEILKSIKDWEAESQSDINRFMARPDRSSRSKR